MIEKVNSYADKMGDINLLDDLKLTQIIFEEKPIEIYYKSQKIRDISYIIVMLKTMKIIFKNKCIFLIKKSSSSK